MSQPQHRPANRQSYSSLPRHQLVVCASLVQNPTNLGGLCRTAEAFRLEALVLADLQLAQNPLFRAVAASSQRWQPLQSCPLAELPTWLQQQKQQGYAILALESHPQAWPLTRFQFPTRSVLLLGQELTGIPPALQGLADWRLTIPQFGLVESLNVQTAAAIAAYEYVRQRMGEVGGWGDGAMGR
ncbi:MAG: TrmH family RNA methyltransferase [Elainella sp.]